MLEIKRDYYLNELISHKENGLIKVITGIRRCGKSYLLFNLFYNHLLSNGVSEDNIIKIPLDDNKFKELRNPEKLYDYIDSRLSNNDNMHYIFLDEVQYAIKKEDLKSDEPLPLYGILNGLLRRHNVDIYVTGSNSKFLSKDVLTEFRGRGDQIRVFPLSFKEYFEYVGGSKEDAFSQYSTYGGLPLVLSLNTPKDKIKYLSKLFDEVYLKDIKERYTIELPEVLSQLTDDLCSSIGSLTNSSKISNTIKSTKNVSVSSQTIASYLEYLEDSFLFSQAKRYDIKGKKYFSFPSKYYCTDIGLRNARLNFRQQEESHIMENILFNELISRGYMVDIGVIATYPTGSDGNIHKQSFEIDFIVNDGMNKYYIQSALNIDDENKAKTEIRPLLAVKDSFKKIIVTKSNMLPWFDECGILHIGLYDFLLNNNYLQ